MSDENEAAVEQNPHTPQIGFDQMVQVSQPSGDAENTALIQQSNETGLAIPEEATVSTAFRAWNDKPQFDEGDLSYPRLRIAQPTTPEVANNIAKAGQFVLTGHQPHDNVILIPLMMGKARELREKGNIKHILCQSKDAQIGHGNPGGSCASCPLSDWSGEAPNRKPPQCDLIYSYICYSVQHEGLVVMEFKKTGKGGANFFNVNIQGKGFGNFAVHLATEKKQNPQNQTYYVPLPSTAEVDPEVFKKARTALG